MSLPGRRDGAGSGPVDSAAVDEGGAVADEGGAGGTTGGARPGAAMVRLRLDVGYDGGDFHGWAAQPGLRTVEGELTAAASTLVREPVHLTVAGRTDAGVHARHQVVHLDVPAAALARMTGSVGGRTPRDPAEALTSRLNGLLARACSQRARALGAPPPARGTSDVVVHRAEVVDETFDARFSATGRHYAYRLCDRPACRDPLRRHDVVWLERGTLDVDAMGEASAALLGEHDFLSFCRPREGATTVRTLRAFDVGRPPSGGDADLVVVRVCADAFCHSMVRSLVGACLEVGLGRRRPEWVAALLAARSRTRAAPIAPARGLTLERVDYPPAGEWAQRSALARARRDCCGDAAPPS